MDQPDAQHPTSSQTLAGGMPVTNDPESPPAEPDSWPAEAQGQREPSEEIPFDGDLERTAEPAPAQPSEKSASEPRPPKAEPKDTFPAHLVIGICVFVFFLLLGAAFLWKAHSDLGNLRSEVAVLKAQSQRAQVLQERAAILRVRAELQSLRLTLPPDLALEVDKADTALTGVDDRLKASQ